MKARIGFLVASCLVLGLFGAYSRHLRTYAELSTTLLAMGGVEIEVKAYETDRATFERAVKRMEGRFRELEAHLTRFRPDSDIGRLNAAAGRGPVAIHGDTLQVLLKAREVAQASQRAFDVTVVPLIQLWKTAEREGREPSEAERAAACSRVDSARLELDPQAVTARLPEGMAVDLGGIGQGLFADEGVRILRAHGIRRGLVNASGEVAVYDDRPTPQPFQIGILDPRRDAPGSTLTLHRGAVATSGNYRRGVDVAGRHRSHILDPVSGRPVDAVRSITVEAPTALEADAWSTACAVLVGRGQDPKAFLPSGFRIHALLLEPSSQP